MIQFTYTYGYLLTGIYLFLTLTITDAGLEIRFSMVKLKVT